MILERILLIALAIIAVTSSTSTKRQFRVYKRDRLDSWIENPFKFMVFLFGGTSCSGAIYNPNTVISAGHCFIDSTTKPEFVELEYLSAQNNSGVNMNINKVVIPTSYSRMYQVEPVSGDDIAVVILSTSIHLDGLYIRRMILSNVLPDIGTEVTIVGYGRDMSTADNKRGLKRGNLEVKHCRYNPGDNRICGKKMHRHGNQRLAKVDSGSPVMTELNGQYQTHGFYSGAIMDEYVFASYKQHEAFIQLSTV